MADGNSNMAVAPYSSQFQLSLSAAASSAQVGQLNQDGLPTPSLRKSGRIEG